MGVVKEMCNGHLTSKVFLCKMCEHINHHWEKKPHNILCIAFLQVIYSKC